MPNHPSQGSSETGSTTADEDDWTKLSNSRERRKVQNRLAQRNYRKNQKKRQEENTAGPTDSSEAETLLTTRSAPRSDGTYFVNPHVPDSPPGGGIGFDSSNQFLRRRSHSTPQEQLYLDSEYISSSVTSPGTSGRLTHSQYAPGYVVERRYIRNNSLVHHMIQGYSGELGFKDMPISTTVLVNPALDPQSRDDLQLNGTPFNEITTSPVNDDQWLNTLPLDSANLDPLMTDSSSLGTLYSPIEDHAITPSLLSDFPQHCQQSHSSSSGSSISKNSQTPNPDPNHRDATGCTLLHLAAEKNHVSILELLLDSYLNINALDSYQRTALHISCLHGHLAAARVLIHRSISLHQADKDGQRALHLAASGGHERVVELLLKGGAMIDEVDGKGRTALQLAVSEGREGVVRVLLSRGAAARKLRS